MPQAKRASKAKRVPRKAVSVLGIAGMSLAASSSGSPADMLFGPLTPPTAGSAEEVLWQNRAPFQLPVFDEEEISDVSLATFSLFDNDLGNARSGVNLQLSGGAAADTAAGAAEDAAAASEAAAACRGCAVAVAAADLEAAGAALEVAAGAAVAAAAA